MPLIQHATQITLATAAALSLAACTAQSSFPPVDSQMPKPAPAAAAAPMPTAAQSQKVATCAGDAILSFIGQPITNLPTTGTWSTLRVIHPGDKVTSDFVGSRLNAKVDGSGKITDIYCG